jgi:hypothetical protein
MFWGGITSWVYDTSGYGYLRFTSMVFWLVFAEISLLVGWIGRWVRLLK